MSRCKFVFEPGLDSHLSPYRVPVHNRARLFPFRDIRSFAAAAGSLGSFGLLVDSEPLVDSARDVRGGVLPPLCLPYFLWKRHIKGNTPPLTPRALWTPYTSLHVFFGRDAYGGAVYGLTRDHSDNFDLR